MTVPPILSTLSAEFETSPEKVQRALEMLDAGLAAPYIGRFRRAEVGGLGEHVLRRLQRRRTELEELDRRRGTILRLLEKEPTVTPRQLDEIRACMDRFELEDLFVPHRRPEPEVQLAIDRGLAPLADLLVAPVPKTERGSEPEEHEADEPAHGARGPALGAAAEAAGSRIDEQAEVQEQTADAQQAEAAAHAEAAALHEASGEATAADPSAAAPAVEDAPGAEEHEEEAPAAAPTLEAAPAPAAHAHIDVRTAMNAALARLCADFVRPDKGIHTETEALNGALRILSDRLGRDARLRGTVRNLLRKHGVLSVRPAGDESRAGRFKSLLKVKQPIRQLQGHRLLAIRQAQKERGVNAILSLDPQVALGKVRNALGRHLNPAWRELLDEVCLRALQHRLLPIVEQDVRLEIKERADHEALRFLTSHLRQVLFTPVLPGAAVAGCDVSAKGDWTLVAVGEDGAPLGPETRIEARIVTTTEAETGPVTETRDKTAAELGAELAAVLAPHAIRFVAVSNGKAGRAAAPKLRGALAAAGIPVWVLETNESGLSTYAGSEWGRKELPEFTVPARMAASLARRLQDPMNEFLKVDPRHLGLGWEQGLVSKANVKRALQEAVESATALAGCDLNRSTLSFLMHLPGLDRAAAEKVVARLAERPFASREELRQEGLLSEAQWTSVAGFLRVFGGPEPLDGTNLHPEQYPLARRLLESAGASVEGGLGRPGALRGLRRADFDIDEATWRDLMRELAFPGRDPRWRQWGPSLLPPDTDPVRITKDRVVEGVVTNVASFGAFVDIGLANDAMIHVSEVSDRYVRDAREVLSIGQVVRARIEEVGGARLAISFKNVPPPERPERPERAPRREGEEGGDRPRRGRRGERGGGGERGPREDRPSVPVRAATTRRDGIGAKSGGRGRGGPGGGRGGAGGGGAGGGGGFGAGGGRKPDSRRPAGGADVADREDLARLAELKPGNKPAHNPFANYFKAKKGDESPAG
ncbi:MAG: S1 RNA-binding domain-containing protein [Planctomycetes bacterium]|nr:S1 RNA-binding domain-containing protein [Planctomycetota bacterium]